MNQSPGRSAWLALMPMVFVVIWSTGFIVARFGMPHAPPMKFLALRYLLSALCFGVWAWLARAEMPTTLRQYQHLAFTGLLMHAGYLGGVWSAVKLGMGAGLVALLVGLQPLLTATWLTARGGRVSGRQWAGLGLGLAGLALVLGDKIGRGQIDSQGFALAAGALFCITFGTLYQKRFVAPCEVPSANLVQLLAAAAVTLPLAMLEGEPMQWGGELVGAMAWSVVALTLGGSSLLYLLIQRGAATTVTSLLYLVPPCTAVLAWLLFAEPISFAMVAGMVLTAVGVSLVVRSNA